ncbi:hypothetical protein Tco_0568166 [Tanacetum coccineum]
MLVLRGPKACRALRLLMIGDSLGICFPRTWVGEASISAAPLSVEDYAEEDTDEALGSVVAVPHLEAVFPFSFFHMP